MYYVIDPFARTIEEFEGRPPLSTLQEIVGGLLDVVSGFGRGSGYQGDALYIDDEGLLKNPTHFFRVTGPFQPFAGMGVVVGTDSQGEGLDDDPVLPISWWRENVSFLATHYDSAGTVGWR